MKRHATWEVQAGGAGEQPCARRACARYEAAEGASEKEVLQMRAPGKRCGKRIVCGRGKFKMLMRAMMLLRLSEPLLIRSSRSFLLLLSHSLSLSERFVCNFGSDFFLNLRYKLPRTTSLNERQRRVRFRKNNGAWQSGWCTKAVMEKRRAACNEVKESG